MKLVVEVDGKQYKCTSKDPWNHNGETCPIHEDVFCPAYAPTLGRGMSDDAIQAAFDVTLGRARVAENS